MTFYAFLADIGGFSVRKRVKDFARSIPAGARILDAGAGQCQYKEYFTHCKYTSIDTGVGDPSWDYSHLDVIAPLEKMPFESYSFDYVLCTEVLEHVQKPDQCLKEMCRVLAKGGTLFLTVPFCHHEHQEPHDFFRYTSYGLKHLSIEAGFDRNLLQVHSIGGIFLRWAYELSSLFDLFPKLRINKKPKHQLDFLLIPFQLLFLVLIRGLQALVLFFSLFEPQKTQSISAFGWEMKAQKALE